VALGVFLVALSAVSGRKVSRAMIAPSSPSACAVLSTVLWFGSGLDAISIAGTRPQPSQGGVNHHFFAMKNPLASGYFLW